MATWGIIPFNRSLHRLALLTCCATFPLIFIGGLVTSKQAGMSVPDWPNSFGYNMFLFPPRYWVGGILFEHTHRLGASFVGFLSILLCAYAWWSDRRPIIRILATAVLAGVIFQGILGGLRVVLVALDLAMIHACVAQAFFCLVALETLVTSPFWSFTDSRYDAIDARQGRQLIWLAGGTTVLIYCQLIVAAIMRHLGAGLAVPDIPLFYGHWLPPTTQQQLDAINQLRVWSLNLPPVTLSQIWLHAAHRAGALVVSLAVLAVVSHILYWHRAQRALLASAAILLTLLAAQVTLGLATVYFRKPADVASAHVAVGALVLMLSFILTFQAIRIYASPSTMFAGDRRETGFDLTPQSALKTA